MLLLYVTRYLLKSKDLSKVQVSETIEGPYAWYPRNEKTRWASSMDAVGNSARLERAHLFTTGFKSSNSYGKCQTSTSKMKIEVESSK